MTIFPSILIMSRCFARAAGLSHAQWKAWESLGRGGHEWLLPPISSFPHPVCWLGQRVPQTPHARVGGQREAGASSVTHKGDDSGREVGLESDGIPGTRRCPACAGTRPRRSAPESGLSYGSAHCLWGWLC